MKYNFDEIIDRRNSDSKKWNEQDDKLLDGDILPMWIADMDFKSCDEIVDALKERADHGVFGYPYINDSVYESIIKWVKDSYNWDIKREWISFTPGVVAGFNLGIRVLTKENEGVIIQPPVYPPFYRVINASGRELVANPLRYEDNRFEIDFEDLEDKLKESKLLLLCSPHNPVGRVWTREELERISELVIKYDAYIVSDEIHGDLVFKDHNHINIGSLSKEMEKRTITLIAPSKTFNIAGLATSVGIIPNPEIKKAFDEEAMRLEVGGVSIFGGVALEASYRHGKDWLDQAMDYIEGNADFAVDYIRKNIPKIKVNKPEGTFLLWLDFKEYGLDQNVLVDLLRDKGRVTLNDGSAFGQEGVGFLRFNIGCPKSLVEEGLKRIEKALQSL